MNISGLIDSMLRSLEAFITIQESRKLNKQFSFAYFSLSFESFVYVSHLAWFSDFHMATHIPSWCYNFTFDKCNINKMEFCVSASLWAMGRRSIVKRNL